MAVRRPPELDVPHWASRACKTYRQALELPAAVTDRMIYARLIECQGLTLADEMDAVRSLEQEIG